MWVPNEEALLSAQLSSLDSRECGFILLSFQLGEPELSQPPQQWYKKDMCYPLPCFPHVLIFRGRKHVWSDTYGLYSLYRSCWLLKGLSHFRKTAVIPCQDIAGGFWPSALKLDLLIVLYICFVEFATWSVLLLSSPTVTWVHLGVTLPIRLQR